MSENSILFQRLFNYIPDVGVRLANSAYVRRFTQSNNWSRMRIGALLAITPSSPAGNLTDIQCYMGLSSSAAKPISSYAGTSFIGARLFPSTLTYNTNSGYPVYQGTANIVRGADRTITTLTTGATTLNVTTAYTGNRYRRTPVIIDFTRPQGGGGASTITVYGCNPAPAQVDYRPDHLMQGLDNWGVPVINGQTLTAWVTGSVNFSEFYGKFDQFEIWWSKTVTPLEVYALGASILLSGYYDEPYGGGYQSFSDNPPGSFVTGTLDGMWGAGTIVPHTSFSGTFVNYPAFNGTVGVMPYDSFNSYGTGTIYSDIGAPNLGYGWTGAGTVLASW